MGLTLLASRFRQGRILAMLLVAGCVIDFSLGVVFSTCAYSNLENTGEHTYSSSPTSSTAGGRRALRREPVGLCER